MVDEQGKVMPGIKVLNIAKDEDSPAVTPLDAENVKSGSTPMVNLRGRY